MRRARTLEGAMRTEKNVRAYRRMSAVYHVVFCGASARQEARACGVSRRAVEMWVRRYEDGGAEALLEGEHPGKRRDVSYDLIEEIALKEEACGKLSSDTMIEKVYRRTGKRYSVSQMNKILCRLKFFLKSVTTRFANAATPAQVRAWQGKTLPRLRRQRRGRRRIVAMDQGMFGNITGKGKRFRARPGKRILKKRAPRSGRVVYYGATADDRTQLVASHKKFDSETTIWFLKKILKKWARVTVIVDNAAPHKSAKVRNFVKSTMGALELVYLPVARPELNSVETKWGIGKQKKIVGVYYEDEDDMRHGVSEFYRTDRQRVDPMAYLERVVR